MLRPSASSWRYKTEAGKLAVPLWLWTAKAKVLTLVGLLERVQPTRPVILFELLICLANIFSINNE